jgi:hypothetical protein
MAAKNGTAQTNGVVYMTRPEAQQYVDRQAQRLLGVSSAHAFGMLDRGELRGTMAEAQLSLLRGLVAPKPRR